MILTSRQLAIILWLVIFVGLALTVPGARKSVRPILETLFSPKLLVLFAVILGYNVAIVWWLWRVGYWDATMLYDTAVFIAVGGIGSVSRAAPQGVTYDGRFFLKTIWVNLEVIVVLTFLSDLFPFNFWVEFLLLIPLITLLVILVLIAQYQKGAENVHRLFSGIQSFIGFLLLGYIVWQVVENYRQLMRMQVLFSLGLPFVMSVFFLPVLFFICAIFAYEDAFFIVSFKNGENKRLARWKKRQMLFRFGPNLKALQEFRRSAAIHEYCWLKSKDEALSFLKSWTRVPADGISP